MDKRNWFEDLNMENRIVCGENGTVICCIPYIFIQPWYNKIHIMTWHSGNVNIAETFETEAELDSFIEALQQAKKMFCVKEIIDNSWEPRVDPFDCFKEIK